MVEEEKVKYSKKPLSIEDQISLLESRGMIFDDREKAKEFLSSNNYYKFAGYWKKFAKPKTHQLSPTDNNNFDFFYDLYINDKKLSQIILKYISLMEDNLRTQYAYNLSINTKSSHPHIDDNNYYNLSKVYGSLEDAFSKSPHSFKEHYETTYEEPLPPIWVLVENLTLGTLVNTILQTKEEKISQLYKQFTYKKPLLRSFFHSLYFVRNQCAHNSILWNIDYERLPEIPNKLDTGSLINLNHERPKIIINFIIILHYLLEKINLGNEMKDEINSFFNSVSGRYLDGYGIKNNISPLI